MATWVVAHQDAEVGEIFIGVVDGNNVPVANQPNVTIKLSDCETRTLKIRWFRFLDANDSCHPKKMLVLCSEPEDDV